MPMPLTPSDGLLSITRMLNSLKLGDIGKS